MLHIPQIFQKAEIMEQLRQNCVYVFGKLIQIKTCISIYDLSY